MSAPGTFVAALTCAIVCVLAAPALARIQDADALTKRSRLVDKPDLQEAGEKRIRLEKGRLAKGSNALKSYLARKPDWAEEILANPAIRAELARDPEVERRLQQDGTGAFLDEDFVARLLEKNDVIQLVLDDQGAAGVVDRELRGYRTQMANAKEMGLDPRAAALGFQAAAQEAEELGNRRAQAEALFAGARVLDVQDNRESSSEGRREFLGMYDEVIALGDADQRSLARNNKGVALLRGADKGTAIEVLEQIDYAKVEEERRPFFRYNLGRAYEADGAGPKARATYELVVAEEPSFRPAVNRLFGVLIANPGADSVERAVKVAGDLLDVGQARSASSNLERCLDAWKGSPKAAELVSVAARSYADAELSPADYSKNHKALLSRIASEAAEGDAPAAAALQRFARTLETVYRRELAVGVSAGEARRIFPDLEPGMHRDVARLLKIAGDHEDNGGRSEQALARYLLSWDLDVENTDALVYLAELILTRPDLFRDRESPDPQDPRPDSEQLVDRVLAEMSEGGRLSTWLSFEEDAPVGRDGSDERKRHLLNRLRLHTLLAAIFEAEKRGIWRAAPEDFRRQGGGPPVGAGWAVNRRTAVCQLGMAIRVAGVLRRHDKDRSSSPALHFRLGQAWRERAEIRDGGEPPSMRARYLAAAGEEFFTAARRFLVDYRNAREARLALTEASGVLEEMSAGPQTDSSREALARYARRLRALSSRVGRLERPR